MQAMAKVRDVYGVRRMEFNEAEKTVRVEYDASRLSGPVIHQLLRRAGLDIVETVPPILLPPGHCACAAGEGFSGLGKGSERAGLVCGGGRPRCAPVAQLDRAFGFEPKGREFESLRAHHKLSETWPLVQCHKSLPLSVFRECPCSVRENNQARRAGVLFGLWSLDQLTRRLEYPAQ